MVKKLLTFGLLAVLPFSMDISAAGFAVQEQSVSGLGRAFAGSAAIADDASTIFFNPAGMTYLSRNQINAGLHIIEPEAEFENNGSSYPLGPLSGRDGDGGETAFIPNFYYAHRVNDSTVAGIGVNAPYGLVTEYDDNWIGRYHAIRSDLKTININPSLAFKANDKLSIGFGINLQYTELELTQAIDYGTVCALAAVTACAIPQNFDGKAKLNAEDWSWGYNLGLMYQASEATRIGMHYRSKISHNLEGKGKFDTTDNVFVNAVATATGFANGNISGATTFPETASLSVHHKVNEQWSISADTTWTRWNRFQQLKIESDIARLNSAKDENWQTTMRYSIGADYKYNDTWQFRSGIAFDETPIPSAEFRTARVPGNDRKWLSFGASYKLSDELSIDSAYSYIFGTGPNINETDSSGYTLKGDYEGRVHILAMQLRWLL